MLDKNGEPMFEPGLINVRELLGSEDPVRYMGIDFRFPICDRRFLTRRFTDSCFFFVLQKI